MHTEHGLLKEDDVSMLAAYALLMWCPVISVLMRSNNVNERNGRIVAGFFLLALGVSGPLIIFMGIWMIIKKRPVLAYFSYANPSPKSIPRYSLYSGLELILAGIGLTSLVLCGICEFWNVDWLWWIKNWYTLTASFSLMSIGITVDFLAMIHFNRRLFARPVDWDKDWNKRNNKRPLH